MRNRWPHRPEGQEEDAGDLSRILAELDKRCTHIEMDIRDKSKSLVVDRLLSGTNSSFTS